MWYRVFVSIPIYPLYESNHVNRFSYVEHGRNHLITSQLGKPLTGARETANNEDGPQGMTTQSTSVNEWVEFEQLQYHLTEGQLCEPIVEHEELAIEPWKLQGTEKEFLNNLPG